MLELLEGKYPNTAEEYKELAQEATNLGTLVREATRNLINLSKKKDYLYVRLSDLAYTKYIESNETFEMWHAKNNLFGDPISLVFHSRHTEPVTSPNSTPMPVLRRVLEAWEYTKRPDKTWTWKGKPARKYGPPVVKIKDGAACAGSDYYSHKIRTGVGLDKAIRLFSNSRPSYYASKCNLDEEGKLKFEAAPPDYRYRYNRRYQTPAPPKTISQKKWLLENTTAADVWRTDWDTTKWPTLKEVKSAIKKTTHNKPCSMDKDKRKKYLEKVMTDPSTISYAIQKRAWVCKVCGAVDGTDPSQRPIRRKFGHQWVSLNRTRSQDLEKIYNLQIAGCLHRES